MFGIFAAKAHLLRPFSRVVTNRRKALNTMLLKLKSAPLMGLAVAALFLTASAKPASAQLNFQYNFSGSFLTDANAAAEQQAVIDGGNLYSAEFSKYFSNSATLVFNVNGYNNSASGVLASAGSEAQPGANPTGVVDEIILRKLQTGVDFNGSGSDGVLNVNFAYSYGLDLNSPPADGQFDFAAILDHEFTHALGFNNILDFTNSQYSVWDTFLTDKNGNKIVNPDFTINQAAFDSAKLGSLNGGGFFFDGANAEAANGGNLVALYLPNAYAGDVSHVDDTVFPTDLMVPGRYAFPTPETRLFSGLDVGILTDLGYTRVAAVPEASTSVSFALLLALGLGGFVITAKKRKKAAV